MTDAESVEGTVSRVVFQNSETAWAVIRLNVLGGGDEVTAVGTLFGVDIGEHLRLTGKWVLDKKFGRQLSVESFLPVQPSTQVGMERYLGSGLIEGIGPAMAERIVSHFGLATFDVIEGDAARLTEVEGIGPVRAQRIREAWSDQRGVKDVMVFLQSHGVSTAYAVRIYKRFGAKAIAVVRENPYQLALDVAGIGFKSADRIAASLGIDKHSPHRVEAGVLHVLAEASNDGHVFLPEPDLAERARGLLGVDDAAIAQAISALAVAAHVVVEPWESARAVFPTRLHQAEHGAAQGLLRLLARPTAADDIDPEAEIAWFEATAGIALADAQKEALRLAVKSKLLVVTGGPGTGKTTIVNGIIRILEKKERRVLLAAPTGRAAKRMTEATGHEAKTIHRLLEIDPKTGEFGRNEDSPLETDALIVDEASMLDTVLADSLVAAVPDRAQLILVGDIDQLPSVGPGHVLGDVIDSGRAAVVKLTRIFRQAERSLIVQNAHRINHGEMPAPAPDSGELSDFYFIERNGADAVLSTIERVVQERIPKSFGLDPRTDVQVLTPMHKGTLGVANLNTSLQRLLNPGTGGVERGHQTFRVGDKVMQTRNDYELGVFNGDIGTVTRADSEERELTVRFDERDVVYDSAVLDALTLAYACSVHKSQGSEYSAVVLPISTQHFVMLHRNLLYTAVTRGRRLVVMVGEKRALAMAVSNRREQARWSRLRDRLR